MAKVTGIVKIYLDGELHRSKPDATLNVGGITKTAQVGHRLYGFSEEVTPSEVSFTLSHMADTDLITLRSFEGTLRFECDTGVTYVISNATVTEPPELSGGGGDVSVTIMGDPAEQE